MKKILVIDDEEDMLNLVKMILESKGYAVLTAGNASEAVSLAEDQHPDLILMDIIMPGMNGIDACRQLKEQEKTADIPVLMFTVLDHPDKKLKAEEAGVEGYITKPFNKDELLEKIEKHFK